MYKKIKQCHMSIGEKWRNSFLVTYPVSYRYNGGIVVDNEWYDGYEVSKPKVPQGFKLTSIGCGLQLNARPPFATAYLELLDGRTVTRSEMKTILAKLP